MKKFLPILALTALTGCGDVAETAIQGAAEAIAKKNANSSNNPPPNNLNHLSQ